MYTLKYCQLCLVVNVRTFAMNTETLEAYSKLLQLPLHNQEPYICYECLALLLKYQEFHAKCLRAHNVLSHFKMQSSQVITHEIFEKQRKVYNLKSKLSLTTVLHDNIGVQHNYSKNTVNVLSNVNSEEKCVHSKVNMFPETNETKTLEYIESASPDNSLTEFKWIDVTFEEKPIVTKDIQESIKSADTSISELDYKPLLNIELSKKLANTTKETNKEIDFKDENKEFTDTSCNYLEDESKNDNDSKEDNNEFSDLYLSNLDEKLVSEIRNSKKLVEQATQIAQSVLLEKCMTANKESNTNNVDLDEKLLINMAYNELVTTATIISQQVQKTRKELNFNVFKGFAKLVRLNKETARNEVLLRKDTNDFCNAPYKCEICYMGFVGRDHCNNHMKKHNEKLSFECEYCQIRFAKKNLMAAHIKNYHSYKIVCTVCDYTTCSIKQGRLHVDKHKGKTYSCDECGLSFRVSSGLFTHKQNVHAREHVCELCGDQFGTPRGLGIHKRQHSQDSPTLSGPRCVECAIQFATKDAYKKHLVVSDKHKGAVSNGCKFCGKTFSNAAMLEAHVRRLHRRYSPYYSCTECPLRLWSARSLWRHMSERHPRATPPPNALKATRCAYTVCEFCGKNVNNTQIRYHMNKHTGERPFECDECGERFFHPALRSVHKRTHAPTQYQCDICKNNFKLKSALRTHIIRIHTGIRPHACHECDKSFHFRCDLRVHVKYTHEKVPWPKKKPKS